MNKIHALVLVLAMSVSGGAFAAEPAAAAAKGWGSTAAPAAAAPMVGTVGLNAGFVLFAAGVAGAVAGSANVVSTTSH